VKLEIKGIGTAVEGGQRRAVRCPICHEWSQPAHGSTYGGQPALCCAACGRPIGAEKTVRAALAQIGGDK
jgi:hypothetical protein